MVDGINYLRRLRVPLPDDHYLRVLYPECDSLRMGISYNVERHGSGHKEKTLVGNIHAFLVHENGNGYKELATMEFSAEKHIDFAMEAREFAESLVSG